MGQTKRSICACFFWVKVFLAILISLLGLVFQSYLVYDLRKNSLNRPTQISELAIRLPLLNDKNAQNCYYPSNSRTARLEPQKTFFWGFDLQWDRDSPEKLVDRLGKRPAIFK
jgi:hypothetical protein